MLRWRQAAAAILLIAPSMAQDAAPYIDNRSTPETLLASLASALSRQEQGRARNYYDVAMSLEARDYGDDAARVSILPGPFARTTNDGETTYEVAAIVLVTTSAGQVATYAACYVMRRPALDPQWFQPLAIIGQTLGLSEGAAAFPAGCGDEDLTEPEDGAPLDDRSSAEALIRSFHDALLRGEYPRARYYSIDLSREALRAHAELLASADLVTVGAGSSHAALLSTDYEVPVMIVRQGDPPSILSGCYTMRPPQGGRSGFESMKIVGMRLSDGAGGAALQNCLGVSPPLVPSPLPSPGAASSAEPRNAADAAQPADDVPYRDDRSTAEALIRSFHNAINRREYARAWSYLASSAPMDLETCSADWEGFARVSMLLGEVLWEIANDASYRVHVAAQLIAPDGQISTRTRCYSIGPDGDSEGDFGSLAILAMETLPGCASPGFVEINPVMIPARIDDRSSGEALVRSLYDAIDAGDFARAWSYFAKPPEASFEDYVAGFDDTLAVAVSVGIGHEETRDGVAVIAVPALIAARSGEGTASFSGCYFVRPAANARSGPFEPAAIVGSDIRTGPGGLNGCLGGRATALIEPPIREVTPGVDRATALFKAAYEDVCWEINPETCISANRSLRSILSRRKDGTGPF